jgi:tRNA(adenine34) deaminase
MQDAIAEARMAFAKGEVPVGAIVVHGDQVVGRGHNQPIASKDPTAHAEVVALRAAARTLGNYRLMGCIMYVTVEPCLMCVGAVVHARLGNVVFGATEPKSGALVSAVRALDLDGLNHRFSVCGGVLEAECGDLMRQFFRERRV